MGLWWGKINLADILLDRRIILNWNLKKCDGNAWAGFIGHRWRALVNTLVNLRIPYNAGNFLSGCNTISSFNRSLLHGVSRCYRTVVDYQEKTYGSF